MKKSSTHILIAEDDVDDRLLIQDALAENGITEVDTVYVENGEELLDSLNNHPTLPTLIFLDLNMPKKDGREALREIKHSERLKHIPVIVFTTSSSEDDIKLSYKHGGNTFFIKPALFSDLVEIIAIIKKYWFEKASFAG